MPRVTFREQRCKGCELCVSVCPQGIIEILDERLNSMGYYPVGVKEENMDKCTACAMCAKMCPDCVITVEK